MSRNAALLFAARLTSAVTTLAVLALISNLRGSEALGLVAVGFASGQIFAVLSELGLANYLIREGARNAAVVPALLGAMLTVRAVTLPIALLGLWAVATLLSPHDANSVWFAGAGLVVQSAADLARATSLSQRRGELFALHAIPENLGWVAIITTLLVMGFPLSGALAGGTAFLSTSVFVGIALIRWRLGLRPRFGSLASVRDLLRNATPYALFSVLATAQSRLDTVLVGAFVSTASIVAAGAYFSSTRLLAAFEYLPETLSLSLLPEVARAHGGSAGDVASVLRHPARSLLYVGIPVPFLMYVIGPSLFGILFSDDLRSYSWVLVALSVLVPLRFFQWISGATLTGTDGQWRRVLGAGLAVGALVVIDVLLLPPLGVAGAIAGTAAGTLIVVSIYARVIRRSVGVIWPFFDVMRALVAAAVAVGAAVAVEGSLGEGAASVAFSAVYVGVVAIGLRLTGPN